MPTLAFAAEPSPSPSCGGNEDDGVPGACDPFLSCMDPNGQLLLTVYFAIAIGLLVGSGLFILLRGKVSKEAARRLTFHSPDDTPRNFKQTGYILSPIGAVLLYSWVVLFGVSYLYIVFVSFFVYGPAGFLWFTPMWDILQQIHGSWNAIVGPYLIIFTFSHLLWLALSSLWASMRTLFMTPAGTLDDPATYVMIEEVLEFDAEATVNDPDAWDPLACMRGCLGAVEAATKSTLLPINKDTDGSRSIEYTCVRYTYDLHAQRFKPQGIIEYTADEVHNRLAKGGLTEKEATETRSRCGKNEINVYVPSHIEALVSEFSDFTYVFNSIGTWSYMVYSVWNIGIFWLAMTLSSGAIRALGIVRPNQKRIADLARLQEECSVLRGGKWVKQPSGSIVLGDIVRVQGNAKLPCDGVVIEGSLVVNESMLTGEPMPIQKMPVENSKNASIGKKNIAYAGTECMQSMGPHDGKAVLIASSVGALTTRGQLVRMVLFPTTVKFKYNDQMPIVYGIIFFYMSILCSIYLSPLIELGDWIAKYLMLMNTVAMCLSPMLPVSLVMGQTVAASRLDKSKIQCLQPSRIPIAGKISTIVFDKTGTITKDGMDFDSVIPVTGKNFDAPIKFVDGKTNTTIPDTVRYVLASCHTVTTLPDGTLVGNAVECSMVAAIGWKVDGEHLTSPDKKESADVVKKLDFDHKRMTSGVIVRITGEDFLRVYVKGSYEKISSISMDSATPSNYASLTEEKAKNGYYVLGVATKTLPIASAQELADMTRDSIEDGLGICGLLMFRNEMKPDSPKALHELSKGGIRSVMCTGDNALTGISIGRQVHIVTTEGVLLGELGKDGKLEWRNPDDDTASNIDVFSGDYLSWNLAVTQGAWRYLHANDKELLTIWKRLVVFARMKPEDKINVVKYFQSHNLVVGMAGDGGNDCGGLRAAHAGLALSDAEASMVSPFSTGKDDKSLMAMVELIREGRACIATNIATFIYFMVYCFSVTMIRTYVAIDGALSWGEFVWFLMDVGMNIGLVWTMTQSGPAPELANYRPTATLLGPRTLLGIVVPVVTFLSLFAVSLSVLRAQEFYNDSGGDFNPLKDIALLPRMWMLRGDNYLSPIGLWLLYGTLVNVAYTNTYGGDFRASIVRNWSLNIVYGVLMAFIFWIMLSEPNKLNCVFRSNCDTEMSLESGGDGTQSIWSMLKFWSAGGLGNCFMGPQVQVWQQEVCEWQSKLAETGQPYTTVDRWLPTADSATPCHPFYLQEHPDNAIVPLTLTPLDSEEISTLGYNGPNNCFSPFYKLFSAGILILLTLIHHMFVKVVMQGSVAKMFRKTTKANIVVELQQPKTRQTLIDVEV